MAAFFLSLAVIFVAELGDKSQLMALAFATRYRPLPVLVGISIATALVHLVSVLVGAVLMLVSAACRLFQRGEHDHAHFAVLQCHHVGAVMVAADAIEAQRYDSAAALPCDHAKDVWRSRS